MLEMKYRLVRSSDLHLTHLVSQVHGTHSVFVEGDISEIVRFSDAFVRWERETSLKWKTCQSRKSSAVESK